MIALVLSVGLLSGGEPALPAWGHLVAPLSLAALDEASAPAPSLAAQPLEPVVESSAAPAPAPVPITMGAVMSSSGSMVAADLVIGGAMVMCVYQATRATGGGGSGTGWLVALVPLSVAFALVPPWFAVLGAEGGLGKQGDRGAVYLRTLGIRLAGFLLATVFPPAVLLTDLVVAPWVATWSVSRTAFAREADEAAARASAPAAFAHPDPDPARLR